MTRQYVPILQAKKLSPRGVSTSLSATEPEGARSPGSPKHPPSPGGGPPALRFLLFPTWEVLRAAGPGGWAGGERALTPALPPAPALGPPQATPTQPLLRSPLPAPHLPRHLTIPTGDSRQVGAAGCHCSGPGPVLLPCSRCLGALLQHTLRRSPPASTDMLKPGA